MQYSIILLLCTFGSSTTFAFYSPHSFRSITPITPISTSSSSSSLFALDRRKFNDLGIVEDTSPQWYIVQVMATKELLIADELRRIIQKIDGAEDDIDSFNVPTRESSYSRGNKLLNRKIVLYPSYIFCNMKLTEVSYLALLDFYRISSFVGRRVGGRMNGIVVPTPLSDEEIAKFQLLVKDGEDIKSQDTAAFLFEIGETVMVTEGPHSGEVGAIRLVRDGELSVRFWTFGSQSDALLKPTEIRKLTEEEREKGMVGPDRAVGQDEIDIALGLEPGSGSPWKKNKNKGKEEGGDKINSNFGGEYNRQRKQDRAGRGEVNEYGMSVGADVAEEKSNWENYKRSESRQKRAEKEKGKGEEKEREKEKEKGKNMGEEEGNFFNDLLKELDSEEEGKTKSATPSPTTTTTTTTATPNDDDNFFNSLLDELDSELS